MMRRSIKISVWILSVVFVAAAAVPANAKQYAEGSPSRAIQDLDDMLGQYRIGAITDEDKAFNRRLKKDALNGTFDIRSLASLSMDKHWEEITLREQNHFVDVLSQLLERKAVFAKEQGGKKSGKKGSKKGGQYFVSYHGDKPLKGKDKGKSMVETKVNIPGENMKITLNYKMHQINVSEVVIIDPLQGVRLPVPADTTTVRQWKIYDVIVDDASLLDNYRYQFDAIIRKGGYAELIRRMESKLKTLIEQEQLDSETEGEPA